MNADLLNHFQAIEDNFNNSLVRKKLEKLSFLLIDDWVLHEKPFGKLSLQEWINLLDTNELIYLLSKKRVTDVKLYNQMAIVTSKGNVSYVLDGEKIDKSQVTVNSYRRIGEDWIMFSSKETESYADVSQKLNFHNWLKAYHVNELTG